MLSVSVVVIQIIIISLVLLSIPIWGFFVGWWHACLKCGNRWDMPRWNGVRAQKWPQKNFGYICRECFPSSEQTLRPEECVVTWDVGMEREMLLSLPVVTDKDASLGWFVGRDWAEGSEYEVKLSSAEEMNVVDFSTQLKLYLFFRVLVFDGAMLISREGNETLKIVRVGKDSFRGGVAGGTVPHTVKSNSIGSKD